MTNDDKIRGKKLQFDINREAAKLSALSSGKVDKYEYLRDKEILPSDQRRVIEQATLTYSPLGKVFEKQRKTIEVQVKKQKYAITNQNERLVVLFNKDGLKDNCQDNQKYILRTGEKYDKIKELADEINHDDLTYYFTGLYYFTYLMVSIIV